MARTTVTLEPDVEALLAREMKLRKLPFKQVLNEAIRSGLSPDPRVDFVFPTYAMGPAKIDIDRASQIAEVLEDEALADKLVEGR